MEGDKSWRRGAARSLGTVAEGALTWQASLGLLFLGDPSTPEVLAALTWPWGEGAAPRSECGKAEGLDELVLHEMNANSRGAGGGGIPMALGS